MMKEERKRNLALLSKSLADQVDVLLGRISWPYNTNKQDAGLLCSTYIECNKATLQQTKSENDNKPGAMWQETHEYSSNSNENDVVSQPPLHQEQQQPLEDDDAAEPSLPDSNESPAAAAAFPVNRICLYGPEESYWWAMDGSVLLEDYKYKNIPDDECLSKQDIYQLFASRLLDSI